MRSLYIYFIILMLSLSGVINNAAYAQDERKWEQYTGKDEEFTLSFPTRPSAVAVYRPISYVAPDKEKYYLGTLYRAYSDGVAYLIYSFPRRKEPLKQFISEFVTRYSTSVKLLSEREVSINNISGKRFAIKFRDLDGVLDFYATDRRAYIVQAVGGDENHPSVSRFLSSLALGKKNDSVAIEIKPSENRAAATPDTGSIFSSRDVTRKPVIIFRPEPQYTVSARKGRVSGTVVIKAVLSSSGEVTNIEVLNSLPSGLTEKAIEVARQMVFIPAVKDGKFVSQTVQVEYNFRVY